MCPAARTFLPFEIEAEITLINVQGQFASWRATGDFDLRSFELRARPTAPLPGLRPGMSALLTLGNRTGVGRTAWREFGLLLRRPFLLRLIVLLPVLMIALLTGIFRAGIPTAMAVAVVDLERSDLSRSITRMLDAAPEVQVTHQAVSLSKARALIVSGAVRGAVWLRAGLERAHYARRTSRDRDLL